MHMIIEQWIHKARELGASDLHAEGNALPIVRVRGKLQSLGESSNGADLERLAQELLGTEAWRGFLSRGSADLSVELAGTRCRINFFRTVRGIALALRLLTPSVKDLRSCNLHPDLHRLTERTTGLVIISGPTGS